MSKKTKTYSLETKLKAVKMYLEDGIGSTTIVKELQLSDENRVLLWVKRFREFGEEGLKEQRGKYKGANKGSPRKQELTLEQENEKLRAEVEYLKKLLQIGRL
ncbi:helix-turn-helix domain-containing protein [Clostridium oceanicum]|uniref:Transposase n=1 Tax=Clostridium oceanicum TaxID=1543 RepID=A0ABN1J919_9CLOT